MSTCRICRNEAGNRSHVAREMLLGTRDEFEYIECARCGCLQIRDIPGDMSKYYPADYYSFKTREPRKGTDALIAPLRRLAAQCCLRAGSNVGWRLLSHLCPVPRDFEWFIRAGIMLDSSVLDVGCGAGKHLLRMHRYGFSRLTGVDPFIEKDIVHCSGLKILKRSVDEIEGPFDFIMLHHTFEHMPKPLDVLKSLHRLLQPGRYVLLRVPVASSYAWRTYGVNWFNMDAPRHLHLHTPASIRVLADRAGFEVEDIVYDSTVMQFYGSEQYARDIPMADIRSRADLKAMFSQKELADFASKTKELNRNNDGDLACFYLSRRNSPSESGVKDSHDQ